LTKDNYIKRQIQANQAIYEPKKEQWNLLAVKETIYNNNTFVVKHTDEMKWKTLLDLDMVKIVAITPNLLSVWKLNNYIEYLKNNDLEYKKYELVFWTKVFGPLTILTMVLLAVPFVFGSVRHISIGKQILLGFLVGIVFYMCSRLIGKVGLVYGVPDIISALLPTLMVMAITVWSYRRIR